MEKPAPTGHPILDVLQRRWSPRGFSDRPIEPHKLRCLFEAARWAASSYNEQPWSFVIATNADTAGFTKALSCLVAANQTWAKSAPLLIFTFARTSFNHNHKPNRVHLHDLGLAVGNLSIQATAMGLFLHQMAGIDPAKVRHLYDVPGEYEPVTAIAVGYPGDLGALPEQVRKAEHAPRSRKALDEIVFAGRWSVAAAELRPDR